MSYDAFISYSHSADGQLAPAVQRGLQRLARPWYRAHALRVFRDETGLSVNPHLWTSIEQSLDESAWFVLLCSPEAAGSPWVEREIEHWLTTKPVERILPVLTEGEIAWDNAAGTYTADSDAIPSVLRHRFPAEPRHLDLRWARDELQLDLDHARFRAAIAELAAPIHGIPKDDLESEDVRVARRARRLARGAVAALTLLTVTALVAGTFALVNERRANREADRAEAAAKESLGRQLAATARNVVDQVPDRALLLAVEGHRISPELATADALVRVLQDQPEGLVRYLPAVDPLGSDGVTAMLAAPDGKRLATTTSEGDVRVWDVARGEELSAISSPMPVLVSWSPTGEQLAWAATDTGQPDLHILDIASGDDRSTGLTTSVAAFSPDGSELAVAVDGGAEIVAADGEDGRAIALGLPTPTAVAWSPDAARVVFAEQNLAGGAVRVQAFDTETLAAVGPAEPFASAAVVPTPNGILRLAIDGDRVTVVMRVSEQGTLAEFDATTGALVRALPGPPEVVEQRELVVAISPDLATIATASVEDGKVRVRDFGSGALLRSPLEGGLRYSPSLSGDPIEVDATAFAGTDGDLIVTGAADGTTRVFAVDPVPATVTQVPIDLEPATARALAVTQSPSGQFVAIVRDGALTLVDNESGEVTQQSWPGTLDDYETAGISDDGVIGFGGPRDLLLWDTSSETARTIDLPGPSSANGPDVGVKVAFAGDRVAVLRQYLDTLEMATQIVFVDAAAGRVLEPIPEAVTGSLGSMDFDGTALTGALATEGGTKYSGHTWNVETGASRAADVPWVAALDVAVAADADVAAGLTDHGLVAWRNNQEVGLFEQRDLNVRWPFAVSHDGRVAASVLGGELRVWDTATGQPIGNPRPVATADAFVTGPVFFSPDDSAVSVYVQDAPERARLARVDLDATSWARTACATANRDLSQAEWARVVGDLVDYRKTCTG